MWPKIRSDCFAADRPLSEALLRNPLRGNDIGTTEAQSSQRKAKTGEHSFDPTDSIVFILCILSKSLPL